MMMNGRRRSPPPSPPSPPPAAGARAEECNNNIRVAAEVSGGGDGRKCLLYLSLSLAWLVAVETLRGALDGGRLPAVAAAADVLWTPWLWFPNNLTWPQEFKLPLTTDEYYPRPLDVLYSVSIAFIILVIRIGFTNYIALPLGRYFKLPENKVQPVRNDILEQMYKRKTKANGGMIHSACKKTGLSAHTVQNWFRMRRNYDKPSMLVKWCEASFKLAYYFPAFWLGLYILWQKDWFHDDTEYYRKIDFWNKIYPMDADVFCYYQMACGFYWSQILTQFASGSVRRKDFWQLFVHHVLTLVLIGTSFAGGVHRFGSLVVLTHDLGDWLLEANKLLVYLGAPRTTVAAFATFVVAWVGSRLAAFPYLVLYVFVYCYHALVGGGGYTCGMWLWSSSLLLLLVLHCIWSYYIGHIVLQYLSTGKQADNRSESDESTGEDACSPPTDGKRMANGINNNNNEKEKLLEPYYLTHNNTVSTRHLTSAEIPKKCDVRIITPPMFK